MSVGAYRNSIERLTKEKASLEKEMATQRAKLSKLQKEHTSITRSISSTTSASQRLSKQRQMNSKQDDIAKCQKTIADLEGKIAKKLSELNNKLNALQGAEKCEEQKAGTNAKKRRADEIHHTRNVTREMEKQVRLNENLQKNRLIIDLALLPTKIKVLFLAANPQDQPLLRLDEEIRAITEQIRLSEYRDSVELVSRWAVRPTDLLQALNELKPQIVHFSGHGTLTSEIVLQADDGSTKLITPQALADVMNTVSKDVQLIIFNACFSSEQAETVTTHIDSAIGMGVGISDEAARLFAAQFYSAIGFGHSVKIAFEQARALLMLESIPEENTPMLFTRDGIDSSQIVLVRPPLDLLSTTDDNLPS